MKKMFRLTENHTTCRTEISAGLTTFFAMAYIIFLNPVFLSSIGMDASGILVATCLSAALGCCLCAFFSNKPFAMASGMGISLSRFRKKLTVAMRSTSSLWRAWRPSFWRCRGS